MLFVEDSHAGDICYATVATTTDSLTHNLNELSHTVNIMGIDMEEAIQAFRRLSEAFKMLDNRVLCNEGEIYNLKEELRSVSDALTENPNQKDDLEIFDAIVPSRAIIKYSEIEWDDEGNMYIN